MMLKSQFTPSANLVNRITQVAEILAKKYDYDEPTLCAYAVSGVACWMVSNHRWKHQTAASKMASLERWIERRIPGTTKVPVWTDTKRYMGGIPHHVNRAPILSADQMTSAAKLMHQRTRAYFWFTCLTAARVGNLTGIRILNISNDGVKYTWEAHKTVRKAGQRTLFLPYWHSAMRKSIMAQLRPGRIKQQSYEALKLSLNRLAVRLHSLRRTAVQHYIDEGLDFTEIKTITLHMTDQSLLRYISHYEPVKRASSSKKPAEGGTQASSQTPTSLPSGTKSKTKKTTTATLKPKPSTPRDSTGRFMRRN